MIHRDYKAKVEWEQDMKCNIEKNTFKDRGIKDYEQYLAEEEEYKIYLNVKLINHNIY